MEAEYTVKILYLRIVYLLMQSVDCAYFLKVTWLWFLPATAIFDATDMFPLIPPAAIFYPTCMIPFTSLYASPLCHKLGF